MSVDLWDKYVAANRKRKIHYQKLLRVQVENRRRLDRIKVLEAKAAEIPKLRRKILDLEYGNDNERTVLRTRVLELECELRAVKGSQ